MAMFDKRLHRIEHCVGRQKDDVPAGVGKPVSKPAISGAPPKTLTANKKRNAEKAFGSKLDEWTKTRSANPDVERQRVFLAYRRVFTGKKALIRKKNAIRNILFQHHCSAYENSVGISELNVVRILEGLLSDRVFESEEHASKECPELFMKPSQDSQLVNQDDSGGIAIKESRERNMSLDRPIKGEHEEASSNLGYLTQDNPRGTPLRIFTRNAN
ncbi:hypothetical protein PMIN04_010300 [Paraphaeosphaeria minitans]